MAFKYCLLLGLFLVAAASMAMAAQAQMGLGGGLLALMRIQGTVFCSANVTDVPINNATASPVFPNAVVQLQCGAGNTVVAGATTDGFGLFSIVLDPLQNVLSTLLTGCTLVVKTPLSTCNANLPAAGRLLSSLQFVGNTLVGPFNVSNVVPAGFQFLPNLN
ncbi:phylloplanin-like [Diospyros lotus]|uniref:phylloplanin-like n=1 Tax=Diospyros lotus TaxID=55363 RepID=UPI002251B5D3|nr:phylloplanin-like [Diospyros lotus]